MGVQLLYPNENWVSYRCFASQLQIRPLTCAVRMAWTLSMSPAHEHEIKLSQREALKEYLGHVCCCCCCCFHSVVGSALP